MAQQVLSDAMGAAARRAHLRASVVGIGALIGFNSLHTGQRMSHENGITVRGTVRIVDDPTFPDHPFFRPSREFPCRVRHGAASWLDDAKLVVRSASLKLADARGASPLDLLLNTGDVPLFWNARTFWTFTKGTAAGRGKDWVPDMWLHPQVGVGGASSVRRDPDSFAHLVYHSQACFGFVGTDGIDRYVRYRLIPEAGTEVETGCPGPEDRSHPWLQNPREDEPRGRNYLKDELVHRLEVERRPVRFRLQIQLRDRPARGRPDWVTAAFPWDEDATPFQELATVTITEALDHDEAQLTWFDIGHHPPSLPIPRGTSVDDPHSMNDLRLAGRWGRRGRLAAYRMKGMPGPFPDSRWSPDWKAAPPMAAPPGPR